MTSRHWPQRGGSIRRLKFETGNDRHGPLERYDDFETPELNNGHGRDRLSSGSQLKEKSRKNDSEFPRSKRQIRNLMRSLGGWFSLITVSISSYQAPYLEPWSSHRVNNTYIHPSYFSLHCCPSLCYLPSSKAVKISTCANSCRIDMEQWAVVRFFTLKGLKNRAIHTELESVYDPEALALPAVDRWRRRFHQGTTDIFDVPRSSGPLADDHVGRLAPRLKKGRSVCVWCSASTSGLERRRACRSFMRNMA
jgi:hypothetical protein